MTIDLVDILDKNCPLRTPEMAFQRIKSSKIFWGRMPPDPPSGSSLQRWPYQKNILILLTQKVDQYTFSAYRPNFGGGGRGWWKRLLNFGLTSKSVDGFIYCDCLNKFRNYFEITFAYY